LKLRIPRPLSRALLVLGATLGTLLVLEATVRVFHIGSIPKPYGEGVYGRESANEILEYEYIPGAVHRRYYQRSWDSAPVVAVHTIGPHGFRGTDFPAAKAPGTLRIACLGDSMTFGRGVNDGETWPARLQAELAARLAVPVEVWNCGMEGSQTREQFLLLRERVLGFDPDVVLLGYFINDVACGRLPPRSKVVGATTNAIVGLLRPQPSDGFLARSIDTLCDVSELFRVGYDRVARRYDGEVSNAVYTAAYVRDVGGWRQVKRALEDIQLLLGEHDVPFGVVLLPLMARQGEALASHEAYGVFAAFCAEQGIPVCDPEPLFADRDPRRLTVHPMDHHLNADAYRVVGAAVAEFLSREALLPAFAAPAPPVEHDGSGG